MTSVLHFFLFSCYFWSLLMTQSRYPQITDELLSAYLDKAVTNEEKALIEKALNIEPAVAWRLESLRQTVQLLRAMPQVTLPRTFTFSELPTPASPSIAAPANLGRAAAEPPVDGLTRLWATWRNFWQLGSPLLRNAAAVSFALFLVLMIGDFAAVQPPTGRTESAPVMVIPPAEKAAPAEAVVATSSEGAAPPVVAAVATPDAVGQAQAASASAARSRATTPQPLAEMEVAVSAPPVISGDELYAADMSLVTDVERENGASEIGASAVGEPLMYDAATDDEIAALPAESISTAMAAQQDAQHPDDGTQAGTEAAALSEADAAGNIDADRDAAATPNVAAAEAVDEVAVDEVAVNDQPVAESAPVVATSILDSLATPQPVGATATLPAWPALTLLQIGAALFTTLFVALWWRSRSQQTSLAE